MFRSIAGLVAGVAVASGLIALLILGEAWLLQRLFPMELWHLALLILGVMAALLFVGAKLIDASGIGSFPFDLDEFEEVEEEDEEDYIGPPPWRRSPSENKSSTRKGRPRRS